MRYLLCLFAVAALSACDDTALTGPAPATARADTVAQAPSAVAMPARVIVCYGRSPRLSGPLYIVDGIIAADSIAWKAMSAPGARVEVLKGASASALYGSRAALGVVIVTSENAVAAARARKGV